MPFTSRLDVGDLQRGWRSLTDRLTPDQVAHLSAMERHPAYTGRPRFLLLEALEYVQPGWTADYALSMATGR
jgi:hypothetical protein